MDHVCVVYNPRSGALLGRERLAGPFERRGVTAELRAFGPATLGRYVTRARAVLAPKASA
ncbi:hypothetical protein [Dactylosporangium sp. NPDC049140]|uniref:hypothetical protein n=1 Tax=Dactylosporangium sp. NPDC049140 TaxID=3155647 RepID=UPI0033EC336B